MRWSRSTSSSTYTAFAITAAGVACAAFAFSATAQLCVPTDTVSTCEVKIANWFAQQSEEAQADPRTEERAAETALEAAVTAANTGAVESPSNPTTSVNDFNPLLQMAADSGGVGNDGEALTININNFIKLPLPDYQAKIVVRQATVNDAVAAALRDAGAGDRVTELEGGFDDFDDATLSLSYNPVRKGMGRNPDDYQEEWLSPAFTEARQSIEDTYTANVNAAAERLETLRETIVEDWGRAQADDASLSEGERRGIEPFDDDSTTFADIDAVLGAGRGAAYLAAAELVPRARLERRQQLGEVLAESDFFALVDLIDNQPQLFASVQAASPDKLVGPRSVGAKLTWEKGWANLNALRASRADCTSAVLACLRSYLGEVGSDVRESLARGDRIALSIEYKKVDDYSIELPDDGILITAPKDEILIGSFTYGRYLSSDLLGPGKPRIDVGIQYEKVDNSTLRQDRFVTTATYSQKISNASILSFGLVYASKPEFRGDVDHEISARVGLNYKVGKPE